MADRNSPPPKRIRKKIEIYTPKDYKEKRNDKNDQRVHRNMDVDYIAIREFIDMEDFVRKKISEFDTMDTILSKIYGSFGIESMKKMRDMIDLSERDLFQIYNDADEIYSLFPKGIPVLKGGKSVAIGLSRRQIKCLISHSFLCTYYKNGINMKHLIQSVEAVAIEKIKCIVSYLKSTFSDNSEEIIIERVMFKSWTSSQWKNDKNEIAKCKFVTNGRIEEQHSSAYVDFANKHIGGGVLGNGALQEECLFITMTECLVTKVIVEPMSDMDVVIIRGVRKYCDIKGYRGDLKFKSARSQIEDEPNEIICIDAENYAEATEDLQYKKNNILRELNKAMFGFISSSFDTISSGKWGCGDFRGDKELKFLIQLVSISVCGKTMVYCTAGDDTYERDAAMIYLKLRETSYKNGDLVKSIMEYNRRSEKMQDWTIFQYVLYHLLEKKN